MKISRPARPLAIALALVGAAVLVVLGVAQNREEEGDAIQGRRRP